MTRKIVGSPLKSNLLFRTDKTTQRRIDTASFKFDNICSTERQLGSGQFGEVYLAEASGVIVPDSKGRSRLKYIRNGVLSSFSRNEYRCDFTANVAVKKLKRKKMLELFLYRENKV